MPVGACGVLRFARRQVKRVIVFSGAPVPYQQLTALPGVERVEGILLVGARGPVRRVMRLATVSTPGRTGDAAAVQGMRQPVKII